MPTPFLLVLLILQTDIHLGCAVCSVYRYMWTQNESDKPECFTQLIQSMLLKFYNLKHISYRVIKLVLFIDIME